MIYSKNAFKKSLAKKAVFSDDFDSKKYGII